MPVSTIANRRGSMFDKKLELRDIAASPIAANQSEAPIQLIANAYAGFTCFVNSLVHTGYVAGTAFWTITVEASTTANGTYVKVGSADLQGSLKEFQIPLSGQQIEAYVPGAQFIRVTATKTGAVGNLTYGAYLAPEYV